MAALVPVKISDEVAAFARDHPEKPWISFEFFPPKTEVGDHVLLITDVTSMHASPPLLFIRLVSPVCTRSSQL